MFKNIARHRIYMINKNVNSISYGVSTMGFVVSTTPSSEPMQNCKIVQKERTLTQTTQQTWREIICSLLKFK